MGNICTRIYYRLQPKRERTPLIPKYQVPSNPPPPTPHLRRRSKAKYFNQYDF